MLAILMLSACKTTTKIVEVPVEVVKKEYIHDTKIDSVYIRDSVDRWQRVILYILLSGIQSSSI